MVIPRLIGAFEFVISRSGSDEKSERSLALLGTWISPCGRNDRQKKAEMTGNRYYSKVSS
jgi:hypothetical protein